MLCSVFFKYNVHYIVRKFQELGSQPLPTIVTEDADTSGHAAQDQGQRPRAGKMIIFYRLIEYRDRIPYLGLVLMLFTCTMSLPFFNCARNLGLAYQKHQKANFRKCSWIWKIHPTSTTAGAY